MTLLTDVEAFVAEEVLPHVAQWDREDVLPDSAWQRLLDLGLPGAMVPREHGGAELPVSELVPVWRVLSQGWISLTGAVNPSGLATALLVRHGTEAQQAQWLPGLATAELHASFSITEPQAGSDLKRLETTAMPAPINGGYVLDGMKRWVAGGVSSDVVFLMCQVEGAEKPSCLVLPSEGRGSKGWQVSELDKIGYRGVESAAYSFNAFHAVGAEVLGATAGRGAAQMLDALDVGRVNVACRALGVLDRAMAIAVHEATTREVGSGLLREHTHAQLRIGELQARTLAVEALVEKAARAIDDSEPAARTLATAAKLQASDTAVWAVDIVSRLAASRGYGADDELARLRRDAPQTQIGEGANDALLMALAREPLG